MRLLVFASVSVLAISAGAAQAQPAQTSPGSAVTPSGPAQSAGAADNTPRGGAPSSVAAQDTSGLQEVVVTAQRREETAQKTPLAISVIPPTELVRQNIVRAEDLSKAVPALVAANNGGANTAFFVRGVGNFTANSYSDPSIAFNYDGVYIGRPTNTQGTFYDLQRIEVLKGPQGTLYGRNATGGAINVIPNRPVLDQLGGDIQLSYGNYNAVQVQGDVNAPLGDFNAVRIAGTYDRHDGYLSDGTSDQDLYGIRALLLSKLTPDLTNRVDFDYSHDGGAGTGSFQYGYTPFNGTGYSFVPSGLGRNVGLADPRSDAYLQTIFITQAGRFSEPLGVYPRLDDNSWGLTDELNWKTPYGTFTFQPAYREANIDSVYTTDDFRYGLTQENDRQYSLEGRFTGSAGPVDYLVGAYYFKENIKDHLVINQLDLTPFEDYKTGTNSKAVFGQLSYHVTPTFTLTGGLRYTSDRKAFDGVSDNYALFCGNGAPGNSCPTVPLEPAVNKAADLVSFYRARGIPVSTIPLGILGLVPPNTPSVLEQTIPINAVTNNDKVTYRLAADWQIAPRSLLYVSYETGYHGGGFSFARGLDSYQPETLDAFTVGSKNRFFGNRLQVNVEGFYWKYKNQQFSQFGYDLGTPPSLVFYTANVGRSTIKGVDADFDLSVTPTTRFSGSVQYLNTNYDSFISYAPNLGLPPNFGCPSSPVIYNGQASFAINCSGKSAFNAPKWSFNLNLAQTFHVGDYNVVAQGGPRYRGSFYDSPTFQPWLISRAAFQSDASVTLSPRSDRWFVTAYINNIEDNRRIVLANSNGIGTVTAIPSDPRTFGVRVGEHFR